MDTPLIEVRELGIFRTKRKHTYEAPRQGALEESDELGTIEIHNGFQFEQSIEDLRGFSHLWVIFQFHTADGWKPMVSPPTQTKKIGVFATRSPHRPNNLGLSTVEIVSIEGRKITVRGFDLIDGTPILDIKPYVATYDSLPEASLGWTESANYSEDDFRVEWSDRARGQAEWIAMNTGFDLFGTADRNLRHKPFDEKHRRFTRTGNRAVYSFRTWRAEVVIAEKSIAVEKIYSGYTDDEIAERHDAYGDKEAHRAFILRRE